MEKKNGEGYAIRTRSTNLIINWGLYLGLAIGFILAAGIARLTTYYHLSVIPLPPQSLIAPKLTFLSIIVALGMFQYRYFYDETTHLDERVQRGDYGPGWAEYIRQAEQTRQFLQTEEQQQAQSQQVLTTAREITAQQPSPATASAIIQLEQSINERAQALAQHRVNLERMDDAIAQARA